MAAPAALSNEERLDRAECRAAIADLIHGYARAIRNGRPADAVALFARDGFFEICQGQPGEEPTVRARFEGHEDFFGYLTANDPRGPGGCPLIYNIVIEFDGPDEARSNAMMERVDPATGGRTLGEYHDTCRRVAGRWYFTGRRFVMFPRAVD